MNQNTIRIINEGAKELEANVIAMFQINDSGDKYSIYTFNEEDAQGLVKIYSSRMVEVGGLYSFVSISNTEEWTKVKDVMKYMAKTDDADGTNGGKIKLIPTMEIKKQMKEPISVNLSETKAAKIGPNYKSGITNCYNKFAVSSQPKVQQPSPVQEQKVEAKPVEVSIPDMNIPSFEIPKQAPTKIEIPEEVSNEAPVKEESVIIPEPKIETPKVSEKPIPMDIPSFEMPKLNPEEKVEDKKVEPVKTEKVKPIEPIAKEERTIEKDEFNFDVPKYEEEEEETKEEVPNVDSILNKASYYQNVKEEETKQNNDNIIQNIGLEFMKKVSELAEYEKELNRKNRDLEARERILTKLEKEISAKEERQKSLNQSNKKKEIELRKYEKELDDRDSDLNRRIIEFNKKISMFQQTFETISKVD